MPDQLIQLKLNTPTKLMMLVTLLVALFASWYVVRWYVGNTMAEYVDPNDKRLDHAHMAVSLAPNDPLPHWRLGNLMQTLLPPDQIPLVVAEYEKAVSLSPQDYRFWTALGQALEQAGDNARAEKAMREAVRLAPAYAHPRWHLGNLLLRTDRYNDAFAELRRASEADPSLQAQLFNLAWQVNKDDFQALVAAIGNRPEARAQFSQYFLKRGRIDEGMRLWATLTVEEKKTHSSAATDLVKSLIAAKRFHTAMEISNEVAPDPAYRVEIGKVLDGGFEAKVTHVPEFPFGWQVPSLDQVQIGITTNLGHSGTRSLRLFFQARSELEPLQVSQLIPVAPNTQYEFECYLKTENLVSALTPVVMISDAVDGAVLATSTNAPDGDSDWQRVSLSFKTGAKSEAVRLAITRGSCSNDTPVCPIFGTVWYDDFNLKPGK